MRNKAVNALIEMGMPANVKGFNYIADIMQLFVDPRWKNTKMMAIYLKVASMNDTTPERVERAIRHAFGTVYNPGNEEAIKKYLSMQKRTNSNLLHLLHLRLSQEE